MAASSASAVAPPRRAPDVPSISPLAFGKQPAAEAEVLVGEDDAGTGAAGDQRGGEARRAAADDEQIAVGGHALVVIGVGLLGRPGRGRRRGG